MKKIITIFLAIILSMAFCFNYSPKAKGASVDPDSIKSEMQKMLSQVKTDVMPETSAVHITADTTWSTDQVLNDNYLVDAGSTLTILPGVTVTFNGPYALGVGGNLVASGTVSQPITFTSSTPPNNYLGLTSESGGNLTLSYCNIDYAGAEIDPDIYTAGITIGGPASIQNCTFGHSAFLNLGIIGNSTVNISNNDFANTSGLAMIVFGDSEMTINNNNIQTVLGGIIAGGIVTAGNSRFTIEGNIVTTSGLFCIGLGGTTESMINDNELTGGLNCLYLSENATATLTNNTFKNGVAGIILVDDSESTINFNTISDNTAVGIFVAQGEGTSPNTNINYNDITGNTIYGLEVGAFGGGGLIGKRVSDLPVNAVKNYWGSSTGPTHTSNPGGTGDAVSDNVTFTPWLDSSFTTAPQVGNVNLVDGQTIAGVYTIIADPSWIVHGLPTDDLTKVDFYIDGELKTSDTTVPYSYDWDTTVHASPHQVRIVATNIIGATDEKTINVEVINQLPYTGK
jgi:parallel beta-helix repeat protein